MENRDLDMGYVFQSTFEVVSKKFVELALLTLVFVMLPTMLITWLTRDLFFPGLISGNTGFGFQLGVIGTDVLLGLLPLCLQASAVHVTVEAMRGRFSDFGTSVSVALSVFFPLLLISILISIGLTIGFLLLVVPGIILMVFWAVVIPAFVTERTGIVEAFTRSSQLTEGQRWRIFGLFLIVGVIFLVISFILGFLSIAVFGIDDDPITTLRFDLIGAVIEAFINGVVALFSAVGVSVLYVHLRELKEGTTLDSIAETFG